MSQRQSASRPQKSSKTQRTQKECCSRVGPGFQADIPDLKDANHSYENLDNTIHEVKMWSDSERPSESEMNDYLKVAETYKYNHEAAMVLLHWHNYSISNAIDDLPNYVPTSNKWTKCEVKKFLKCIDSKPRKDFMVAKKTMPGRPMGEISQMYYSIAAPFKAPPRTRDHSDLLQRCLTRAVRNNLITSRWPNTDLTASARAVSNSTGCRRPGESSDALEREIELHLVDLVGISAARRLLGRRMLSTSYPLLPSCHAPLTSSLPNRTGISSVSSRSNSPSRLPGNVAQDHSSLTLPPLNTSTRYQISSSGASSQLGSESTGPSRSIKYGLPPGVHYDHAEFVAFMATPEARLAEERASQLASAERLDMELLQQVQVVEDRACSVLNKIGMLKPACGFPEISYRWTKAELALVLTAMSKYGNDFSQIACTIGSKTESFIRDFYNQFRHRFPLDEIMRLAKKDTDSLPDADVNMETTKQEFEEPTALDHHAGLNPSKFHAIIASSKTEEQSCTSSLTLDEVPAESITSPDSRTPPTTTNGSEKINKQEEKPTTDNSNMEQSSMSVPPVERRKRGRPPCRRGLSRTSLPMTAVDKPVVIVRGRGRRGRRPRV
ncbi:REST corepressor [Paragonimus heterotremus]|uniref:REST corepressor n=1 Tax=Paragonimus heterotremus TaxID=100268 RepID=A0A8J4SWP2_9TREM|nr:REST corepressor [Paragonimus heterotremus]